MTFKIQNISWKKFQDLCLDILKEEGFRIIRKSGIGPDRGMDILVSKEIEYAPGNIKEFIWLVQCKHKTNDSPLKPQDVGDFTSDIPRHGAEGYWLMTNAYLSTGLEDKISSVDKDIHHPFKATYSNGKDISDFLYKYRELLIKYTGSDELPKKKNYKPQNINPFKELQSFGEADQSFFFGRDLEINELLSKVYRYKIVGLFGESGTGKTSLINAGIIPCLKRENFCVVSVRCLDEPIERIRRTLFKILKERKISDSNIHNLAVTNSFPQLLIGLKNIVEQNNINLIFVIDQLEEIFTRANESERQQLSKGIMESLIVSPLKGKISFLLSLREDFIGELWEWSHKYSLEDAWVHTYRIARFDEKKAHDAIFKPLQKLNIKVDKDFVVNLIVDLKRIGDGYIYPPYLQIVCSILFEEYLKLLSKKKLHVVFGKALLIETHSLESLIADYLSDSMLEELTEEEKLHAQNIMSLLTGPEGLRAFLNIDEISRYVSIDKPTARHILEHLTKKKIVHPIVEKDLVVGYELVHDFLSKKFFEKLEPEAKRTKTTIEIFRKAFKEWKQHSVLASKDRLQILLDDISQLSLNKEEWFFLIKSSFSVYYWYGENKWINVIDKDMLIKICQYLLTDDNEDIAKNAIRVLGKVGKKQATDELQKIIELPGRVRIREAAIDEFWFDIIDRKILGTLKNIIRFERNYILRKAAVNAFATNIKIIFQNDLEGLNKEIEVLHKALNDSITHVRKAVIDALGYKLMSTKSIQLLIDRLHIENSITSKKAIVYTLVLFLNKGIETDLIFPLLEHISTDSKEDYRIREEAKQGLFK